MAQPTKLEDLIANWGPRIAKAFMDAIGFIRDAAQIGLIAKMLERGDIDGAVRAVGLDPVAFRTFDTVIGLAFEAGGNAAMVKVPAFREPSGHRLEVRFNARNPRAEGWLRDHSSNAVTAIVEDQRVAIRQTLTAGMAAGSNPRDVALDIVGRINPATGQRAGGTIGLTASQEVWAKNYADEIARSDGGALTRALRDKRFDRTVAKAIKDGTPIAADVQAKMVAAYRNRALRYRGEAIGRTEAITSLHQAQDESFKQAIDAGQVKASHVRKVWRSAGDARVRETHRILDGESVGLASSFRSPSGARLRFPGDPLAPAAEIVNCRCSCEYRVDFLANVA